MDFLKGRHDLRGVDVDNKWRIILTEEEIKLCVQKCANIINEKFIGKNVVVVCILKGAICFFNDLTAKLKIPHSWYFIEASSYRNNQTQDEEVEILSKIIKSKFDNRYVILVDELFDNGTTISMVKNVISEKADVPKDMIFTCTLFKKDKPDTISPDLYGIKVPNVWLVGYGLDDHQEKRNWTYLFACPKIEGIPLTEDDQIFTDTDYYDKVRSFLKLQIQQKFLY